MRELIDRQETLNAIDKRFESLLRRFDYDSYENADEKTKLVCDGLSEAEDVVMGLPSAQPEIIRCKNCKHWIPYDWMFSEVWRSRDIADYSEDEIGCKFCDMTMKANDFCSRAERRKVTT